MSLRQNADRVERGGYVVKSLPKIFGPVGRPIAESCSLDRA